MAEIEPEFKDEDEELLPFLELVEEKLYMDDWDAAIEENNLWDQEEQDRKEKENDRGTIEQSAGN